MTFHLIIFEEIMPREYSIKQQPKAEGGWLTKKYWESQKGN